MKYYSQFKQDEFLDQNIFKDQNKGFFVEIGADDGVCHSNTLFFEKYKNWQGICIEPRKKAFDKLKKNRKCICENICISNNNEEKEFLEIDGICSQYSGLCEKYDKEQLKRIEKDTKKLNSNKKIIKVQCITLKKLLNKYNVNEIDYCSIDVEGGELDILKTINFSEIKIKIISVENNFDNNKIKKYLKKNNYRLIKKLIVDEIYALNGSGLPEYHEPFNLNNCISNVKKGVRKKINKIIPDKIKQFIKKVVLFISKPKENYPNWLIFKYHILKAIYKIKNKDKNNAKEYMCYHAHDISMNVERKNVIYLYRNPVETVYSQLNYSKQNINNKTFIKYWANIYGLHLEKWLLSESFTNKKTVLTYEGMKNNMSDEFSKVCNHFNIAFDREKLNLALKKISKEKLKATTGYDQQIVNLSKNYIIERKTFADKHSNLVYRCVYNQNEKLKNFF